MIHTSHHNNRHHPGTILHGASLSKRATSTLHTNLVAVLEAMLWRGAEHGGGAQEQCKLLKHVMADAGENVKSLEVCVPRNGVYCIAWRSAGTNAPRWLNFPHSGEFTRSTHFTTPGFSEALQLLELAFEQVLVLDCCCCSGVVVDVDDRKTRYRTIHFNECNFRFIDEPKTCFILGKKGGVK